MADQNVESATKEALFAVASGVEGLARELKERDRQNLDLHEEIRRLKVVIGSRDAEISQIKARIHALENEKREVGIGSGNSTSFEQQLRGYVAENERLTAELLAANKIKDNLRHQLAEANSRLGKTDKTAINIKLKSSTTTRTAAKSQLGPAGTGNLAVKTVDVGGTSDDAEATPPSAPQYNGPTDTAEVATGFRGQGTATNPLDLEDSASAAGSPPHKRLKASDTITHPNDEHAKAPNGLPNYPLHNQLYDQHGQHGHYGYNTMTNAYAPSNASHLPSNQYYLGGANGLGPMGYPHAQGYPAGTVGFYQHSFANNMNAYNPAARPQALPASVMQQQPASQLQASAPGDGPTFILRKDPESFLSLSTLPKNQSQNFHKKLGDAMNDWANVREGANKQWYQNLLKVKEGTSSKACLYGRYNGGGVEWTIADEMKYACMRCTNRGRLCCIWDAAEKRIIVLPLVPLAKQSEKPEEMGYWARDDQQAAVGNKTLRALFKSRAARPAGSMAQG